MVKPTSKRRVLLALECARATKPKRTAMRTSCRRDMEGELRRCTFAGPSRARDGGEPKEYQTRGHRGNNERRSLEPCEAYYPHISYALLGLRIHLGSERS